MLKRFVVFMLMLVVAFSINSVAFGASPESDFLFNSSTGTITKYTGPGGAVEIPVTIGGKEVTSIGPYAFSNRLRLTSITIPAGVTSIGSNAFSYCERLTSITIPDTVTSIGGEAFHYCERLTSITIPDSVTSIGGEAFSNCTRLTSITIPDSVTSIGRWAFAGCTRLTSITIPDSVTSIEWGAFLGCANLEKAEFRGAAPALFETRVFDGCASDFTITYYPSQAGWTTPLWNGYTTAPILYTVTFNNEGMLTKQGVTQGGIVTPPTPSKTGHTFQGWYTASTGGTKVTNFTDVTAGTTYYAQWKISMYNVLFINGTSKVTKSVFHNTTTSIASPTKSGYKFMGWYDASGTKFSPTTPITADATYTARFYSTNAYLKKLTASTGKWSNKFSKTRYSYTLTLSKTKSEVKLTASKAQTKAKVSWSTNKKKWYSGSNKTISISKGKSLYLYFKVTAQSGAAKDTKTYKVKVTRKR